MINLYCAGCSVSSTFPNNCLENCPNLTTKQNKHAPTCVNYFLINNFRNHKKDLKCNEKNETISSQQALPNVVIAVQQ